MQLDKTEIVIRQRSTLELLDLSLVVIRKHWASIIATCLLFGLPLLVIDILSTAWMLGEGAYLASEHLDEPETAMRWRHAWHIVLLYMVQFQLISLPTTVFLGNQIFYQTMPVRKLIGRLAPIAWRCVLVLGLYRLGLVTLVLEFVVNRQEAWDWDAEFWLIGVLPTCAWLVRACWPFAPEILGLELCTLRSDKGGGITYGQRSKSLHRLLMADHFARMLIATAFAIMLSLMLLGLGIFCKGVATGSWIWTDWLSYLLLPSVVWTVGLFMAVFRFLSYLDSRIRLEGWEIELRLKAEASRMVARGSAGQVAAANASPEALTS